MAIKQGFTLPATELDGKQVVVQTPASRGFKTWFTGAGDLTSSVGRGLGSRFVIEMTGSGTGSIQGQFSEPVEVHDGGFKFSPVANFDIDDYVEVCTDIPANTPTANTSSTGNCNLVDSGAGYNIIVPAAGDGAYDIVTGSATPIIVTDELKPDGYWNVDKGTGAVTAATPGQGNCNLIDQSTTAYFVRKFPFANETGNQDVDVYKVEWVHQNYNFTLVLNKTTAGAGKCAMWLLCFRKNVTES